MKKSIKKIISLALVMTMLLLTMMVVSAEGTIAADEVSFEEELMPMTADYCGSNYAYGFTGRIYSYRYNSSIEIVVRVGEITNQVSLEPSDYTTSFASKVNTMNSYYNNIRSTDYISARNHIKDDSEIAELFETSNYNQNSIAEVLEGKLVSYYLQNNSDNLSSDQIIEKASLEASVLSPWLKCEIDAYRIFYRYLIDDES